MHKENIQEIALAEENEYLKKFLSTVFHKFSRVGGGSIGEIFYLIKCITSMTQFLY